MSAGGGVVLLTCTVSTPGAGASDRSTLARRRTSLGLSPDPALRFYKCGTSGPRRSSWSEPYTGSVSSRRRRPDSPEGGGGEDQEVRTKELKLQTPA